MKRYVVIYITTGGHFVLHNIAAINFDMAVQVLKDDKNAVTKMPDFYEIYSISLAR